MANNKNNDHRDTPFDVTRSGVSPCFVSMWVRVPWNLGNVNQQSIPVSGYTENRSPDFKINDCQKEILDSFPEEWWRRLEWRYYHSNNDEVMTTMAWFRVFFKKSMCYMCPLL